jgi:hypothetical protein
MLKNILSDMEVYDILLKKIFNISSEKRLPVIMFIFARTEKFTEPQKETDQKARSNFCKNVKLNTAELRKTTDSKKIT